MNPKVLIGCPTCDLYEYSLQRYVDAVKEIDYDNFDLVLVDNSKNSDYVKKIEKLGIKVIKGPYYENVKQRIVDSRNLLSEYAIQHDYDYFLSLEQDVLPPKNVIQQLLSRDEYIVSGVYFAYNINNGVRLLTPLLWKGVGKNEVMYLSEDEVFDDRFFSVAACGLGCVLIKIEVLKFIKFRYEDSEPCFDDMFFCLDASTKGYSIYADTSIKCVHLINEKKFDVSKV